MVTANTRVAQLPNQIPPQSSPVVMDGGNGTQIFETNWWLFFYNIASQVISLSGGSVTLPDSVNIALIDSEIFDTDSLQASRQALNAQMLVGIDPDPSPTSRDLANAIALAADELLPDPTPRAQSVSAVTVGASPFTFTVSFSGAVVVSGGTVSAIALIRQGITVPTGITAGVIPASRLDQVQITYTVAPTVNFLPT